MIYFAVLGLVVVVDQLSKWWIVDNFSLYSSKVVIPGFFNLVYVTNTGAAFSLFADIESPFRHYGFIGIGIAATIGLTFLFFRQSKWLYLYGIAFGCIAGGALGNVIDRIRVGAVVDFLEFYLGRYYWPAFNVADSAIFIGVGLFLLANYLEAKHSK